MALLLTLVIEDVAAQAPPLPYWQHTAWVGDNAPADPGDYSLLASADGYLWLGATNGLIRFDGVRFTLLDSTTIPALRGVGHGQFNPMLLDRRGRLWLKGPGGSVFTYADGVIRAVFAESSAVTGSITPDGAGRLWVSTRSGLRLVEDDRLVAPTLPPGVPTTDLYGLASDTADGLWIGTSHDGVWHVSRDGVEHLASGRIRVLLQSRDGAVWAIGEGLGAGLWRRVAGRWSAVHPPGEPTRRILTRTAVEGADGSVWFATPDIGLLRWHDGHMEQFSTNNGLSNSRVHTVYADEEGAIWASTDAGIDRLRPSIFSSIDERNGLPHSGELFAEDTSGAIWYSMPAGTRQYLLDGGVIRNRAGAITARRFVVADTAGVQLIAPSHTGGVWIGPFSGGIVHLTQSGQVAYGRTAGFPGGRMGLGFETRDGTLWLRSIVGDFGRFRNGRYTEFPISAADKPTLHGIAEDARGRLWFMSAQRHMTMLMHDSVVDRSVIPAGDGSRLSALAFESDETMWASSHQSLVRITGHHTAEVRMPSLARVLGAGAELVISHGWLWMTSEAGIARVSLKELHSAADAGSSEPRSEVFAAIDGMSIARSPTLTPTSMRVARDGRVWVATPSGLAVADPAFRIETVRPRTVRIEGVSIGSRPIALRAGDRLPPKPDRLTFHFTVPSLFWPERVRLQYRLDGADDQWIDATLAREATYSRLGPGQYRFRVRGWDDAGRLIPGEASLAFRVRPAWYQSIWFIILCIAAVGGGAFAGAFSWQKRRGRRAVERERARFDVMLTERARIARELHDTLLQGFTGITLQLDSVRDTLDRRADPSAIELAQVLRQADLTLREAREMVWDMRTTEADDLDLGAQLESGSRRLLSRSNLALHHSVSGLPRPLPREVESTLLRIGREAVFNALQHAGAESVRVELAYEEKSVALSVRDDGHGADPARIATAALAGHWGVAGMRERVARIGGTLIIDTALGEGMRILVSVPL